MITQRALSPAALSRVWRRVASEISWLWEAALAFFLWCSSAIYWSLEPCLAAKSIRGLRLRRKQCSWSSVTTVGFCQLQNPEFIATSSSPQIKSTHSGNDRPIAGHCVSTQHPQHTKTRIFLQLNTCYLITVGCNSKSDTWKIPLWMSKD